MMIRTALIPLIFVIIIVEWSYFGVKLADAFSPKGVLSSSASLWNHVSCKGSDRGTFSRRKRSKKIENSSVIFLREPQTQETPSDLEKEDESELSMDKRFESHVVEDTLRKISGQVGKAAVYSFSYAMNVIGLYFTFGLVLNIFGYAYEFSFKEGYKIDTIKNKRIELQFERESRKYEKERNERTSGLGSNRLGSETVAKLKESTGDSKLNYEK